MEYVLDVQGFKQPVNDFVVKELAIIPLRENSRTLSPLDSSVEVLKLQNLQQDQFRSQARILNLEIELERERHQKTTDVNKQQNQELSESLKKEAEQARKDAERLEKDFANAAEERDKAKIELEEMKKMYINLEKRMKAACKCESLNQEYESDSTSSNGSENDTTSECECNSYEQLDDQFKFKTEHDGFKYENEPIVELIDDLVESTWWNVSGMALAGCPSAKDVARIASQRSTDKPEPVESEVEEDETTDEESEEEDPKIAEEKRQQREIRMMKTKIKSFKDKTDNSKKERQALKNQIKLQQKLLKDEKKKFKALQKEVNKMAKLMADDDEQEEEEEEEQEEEEEEEDTESEEESESEESEDDETSETDDESSSLEKRKTKLQSCIKRYEGRLTALKKGNYLLKAQVDRLKDDLSKQREESATLQEDLDSVLAELG